MTRPSREFRTYTDTQLRELIEKARAVPGVQSQVMRYRMVQELAIRKSLRLEGKSVLVKAAPESQN